MKIGIISDTHDHKENITKAVKCLNDENVDMIIHAGDIIAPFTIREFKKLKSKMTAVYGNNDGEREGLKKFFDIHTPPFELNLDSKKFVIMHDPLNLEALKKSNYYDVIIYGHLHEPLIEKKETLVVNPGEVCAWLTGKATIAILHTDSMDAEIIEL